MTDEERLRKVNEIKDYLLACFDFIRFNTNYNPELKKSFANVKQALEVLQCLSDDYIDELPNCSKIIVLEDVVIENEQQVEVKTNITGLRIDSEEIEVSFKGYIPSEGSMELSFANKEWGLKILAKNNIPISVKEEHDVCGYHYSDPTSVKYFPPGIYKLEKGTVIGLITKKNKRFALEPKK